MYHFFTAVEATTLNERSSRLRPQDRFLRDNIRPNDTLIVSVGGNDVALCPTPCTIVSMLGVLSLPVTCVENGFSCGVAPVRDQSSYCKPLYCLDSCSTSTCFSAMTAAVDVDRPYSRVLVHAHHVLATFGHSLGYGFKSISRL